MVKKELKEMSFLDHLEDLRWLLIRITGGVLVISCLSYFIIDYIFDEIIFAPIHADFITYRLFCDLTKYLGADDGGMCIQEMPFIIQSTEMGGQLQVLFQSRNK